MVERMSVSFIEEEIFPSKTGQYVFYSDYKKLEQKNNRILALLLRYRNEVPLGHQPHMIAHLVDEVLNGT